MKILVSNSKNEKSTLGDLDALSNLKTQMENDAKSKSTLKMDGDDAAK